MPQPLLTALSVRGVHGDLWPSLVVYRCKSSSQKESTQTPEAEKKNADLVKPARKKRDLRYEMFPHFVAKDQRILKLLFTGQLLPIFDGLKPCFVA